MHIINKTLLIVLLLFGVVLAIYIIYPKICYRLDIEDGISSDMNCNCLGEVWSYENMSNTDITYCRGIPIFYVCRNRTMYDGTWGDWFEVSCY